MSLNFPDVKLNWFYVFRLSYMLFVWVFVFVYASILDEKVSSLHNNVNWDCLKGKNWLQNSNLVEQNYSTVLSPTWEI